MGWRKNRSSGYAPGIRVDENGTTIFLQCIISGLGEYLSFEVRRPKSASFAPSRRQLRTFCILMSKPHVLGNPLVWLHNGTNHEL